MSCDTYLQPCECFYSSPFLKPEGSPWNRPFAASHSRGTNLPYWRAREALGGTDKGNYHIHIQILQTDLRTFPLRIS